MAVAPVECFRIPGVDCWFWSNDHDPAHFHAELAGKWEVAVCILPDADPVIVLKYGKRLPGSYRKALLAAVAEHRQELLGEWERKVCSWR